MRKFLLATTATAVVLSAYGLAHAQTSSRDKSGTQTQMAPSQSPSTSGASSGSANTMTTGQSNTGANSSAEPSTSAQQASPSAAGSGSSTNSSGANAASQAQVNTNTTAQPTNRAQQSPSGAGTSSTAQQQQPSANTNTAQRPSENTTTNTAQQPPANTNTNTAQRPTGNANTNTAQQPGNPNVNTAQRPAGDANTAQRPSGANTAESGGASVNGAVSINERERTRLGQTFAKLDVHPLNNVNFNVSVGTVVPRDIRLEVVPSDVVEIVPRFRGYKFFAVRDEIVIVEPSSLKIVAVLPRSGGGSASVTTERKSKFSEEDRALMRKHMHVRAQAPAPATTGSSTRTHVIIGERVPDSVEIRSFPEEVYRESPRLKEYRYIEEGDRSYVVEPSDRRVIEEIE